MIAADFNSNKENAADFTKSRSSDNIPSPIGNQPVPKESTYSLPSENANRSILRSIEQDRSMPIPDSLQANRIDKRVYGAQENKLEEMKDKNIHRIYDRKPSDDTFPSTAKKQKKQIRYEKISKGIEPHQSDQVLTSEKSPFIKNDNFSRSLHIDTSGQLDMGVLSSIADSLNLPKHLRTPSLDNLQVEETTNRQLASDETKTEVAVTNNNSYFNYEKRKENIPNIRVNRLEIHVVGSTRHPTYSKSGPKSSLQKVLMS